LLNAYRFSYFVTGPNAPDWRVVSQLVV
jgi:hypothetical protein